MLPDDDPGWPKSPNMLALLVPRNVRSFPGEGRDGLIALRRVFLTFCIALALLGVVLAFLYPSSAAPADPPTALAGGLLLLGGVGVLLSSRFERPLDCTNDTTLALSYRMRFFHRIAVADSAALLGFVGFFLTYEWWPYPVGIAIAACGFVRAAPTRGHLRHDQQRLAESSCFRPLVHALRTSMSPRA